MVHDDIHGGNLHFVLMLCVPGFVHARLRPHVCSVRDMRGCKSGRKAISQSRLRMLIYDGCSRSSENRSTFLSPSFKPFGELGCLG